MPRIAAARLSQAPLKAAATTEAKDRQRINLSLRVSTVDQARALGLNISRIAEDGLAAAVREEKARRWSDENRVAIEHFNARIDRDGPLNADLLSF